MRQAVPALWILFLAACLAGSFFWAPARLTGLTALIAYLIVGLACTGASIPRTGVSAILFLPLALSIHLAYGLGMWLGVAEMLGRSLGRIRPLLSSLTERTLAFFALVLLSPVLLVLAVGVLIESGSPALFRQERVGRNGRAFTLFKLRSMQNGKAGTAITAASDSRITPFGRILRKYKLDELPQLWNVLKGEMSLVGPRPELATYVDLEDTTWRTVLSVTPGLTDPATLLYRDEEKILAEVADVEQFYRERILPAKLALNIAYLKVRSPWLDLKVIGLTAWYSFFPRRFDAAIVRKTFFSGETIL